MNLTAEHLADGDRVAVVGLLAADGPFRFVEPPQPIDRYRSRGPLAGVSDTAVRLVVPSASRVDLVPTAGQWARITGIWVERQITVDTLHLVERDLALIDIDTADVDSGPYGSELAREVTRIFSDRSRRWDLLMLASSSGEKRGPVAVVAAVRALPEIDDFLESLPAGAVDFRAWLTKAEPAAGTVRSSGLADGRLQPSRVDTGGP